MTIAFLFPGQGSQRVGMGLALAEHRPDIKERYFDRADRVLGFEISRLCFTGPEEALVQTENQQPAIFLVSCAMAAVLAEMGVRPAAAAGHSLGEYAALVTAGSIGFEEGLRLTRARGEMMAAVAARTGGIMAAIVGLPAEEVGVICAEASARGVCDVANYNSPTQTVISGQEEAVCGAMEAAKGMGARIIQLNVSAPFHSSLMAPLAEEFATVLDAVPVADPRIPVVANVTARDEPTADEVRRNLIAQLASSVRWTASMQHLVEGGADTVVEVGPGKVLTGLMRQIAPEVRAYPTADPAGIEKAAAAAGVS